MSEEESMFGYEPKPTTKSKPKVNLTKWFALGVGGLLGLSHIGMIGMISKKSTLPKFRHTSNTIHILRGTSG